MGTEQGSPENCETITENTPWGELGQGNTSPFARERQSVSGCSKAYPGTPPVTVSHHCARTPTKPQPLLVPSTEGAQGSYQQKKMVSPFMLFF